MSEVPPWVFERMVALMDVGRSDRCYRVTSLIRNTHPQRITMGP